MDGWRLCTSQDVGWHGPSVLGKDQRPHSHPHPGAGPAAVPSHSCAEPLHWEPIPAGFIYQYPMEEGLGGTPGKLLMEGHT